MRIKYVFLFSIFSLGAKTLFLFDVDGTLTIPRKKIELFMVAKLKELKDAGYGIGLVGGSDLSKIKEQLSGNVIDGFDYVFAENGLVGYKNGKLINKSSIKNYLTTEQLNELISFCLRYIADLDVPIKRGTFIEFRNGMINISPIGRNCTQDERIEFNEFDQKHKIREKMVVELQKQFANFGLTFSIGGQISIDLFPKGWDKTYCLQFLKEFDKILFFGDRTAPGGNDHEIFSSPLTEGCIVVGPKDLIKKLDNYLC